MAHKHREPIPVLTDEQRLKKDAKSEQARINGRNSKGPTSEIGTQKSSRNAIRHGLTANEHTLLTAEFADEYDEVRTAFIDDLRPATKAELRLVEKIANLDWRLERLVMMETSLLNMAADINFEKVAERFSRIDGIGFIVEAWRETSSTSHCLDLLRRYMGTLQHQFNSTLSNFRNFEKSRLARTQGGRNLDEEAQPAYKAPKLDSHLPSYIDEPPLSYDDIYGDVETPVQPTQQPQRNEPTPLRPAA